MSDLWLWLTLYIIYNLCGSWLPEYARVDRFVKHPKTVWKGLELQIEEPLFQKRTAIYLRTSRLCPRLYHREIREKFKPESNGDSFGFVICFQFEWTDWLKKYMYIVPANEWWPTIIILFDHGDLRQHESSWTKTPHIKTTEFCGKCVVRKFTKL